MESREAKEKVRKQRRQVQPRSPQVSKHATRSKTLEAKIHSYVDRSDCEAAKRFVSKRFELPLASHFCEALSSSPKTPRSPGLPETDEKVRLSSQTGCKLTVAQSLDFKNQGLWSTSIISL